MRCKFYNQIILYTQDVKTNEKPWELWEFKSEGSEIWLPCHKHPSWINSLEYRHRKIEQEVITMYTNVYIDGETGIAQESRESAKRAANGLGIKRTGLIVTQMLGKYQILQHYEPCPNG